MKKTKKNTVALFVILIAITISFTACSKDENNNPDPNANNGTSAERVINTAQSGTWRISYFWDTDTDETSNFDGYVFTFNSDGTLVASKGNTSENGTWSVIDDPGNSSNDDDGNSTDDDDFNILFNVAPDNDFDDLNDNWDIVEVTDSKMELTDVSGGNGGVDFLTFMKN